MGSARTIAFGASIVSPSASAATVLVLVMAYAGFASPLVVLITLAGSVCGALGIGQFAGRVPSAGWSYTYNSRGLGPAGSGLTSAFGSRLVASTLHVTIDGWVLFIIILAVAVSSPFSASLPRPRPTLSSWPRRWRSSRRWPSPSG